MNKAALYHRPEYNYAFAKTLNEIQVRFRTAKNDVDEVNVFYGEKFNWVNKQKKKMVKIQSDEYSDYYQYNIEADDVRLGYYFEVIKEAEVLYYTEAGILDTFDNPKAHTLFFNFPAINSIDLFHEPSWVKDAIFYQIFVERFANGDDSLSPEKTVPWDSLPTPVSFYGGDLVGIQKNLDYLVDLGINAIYLTPIFKSKSNHKYDTIDYMEIDEHFGTKADFKRLVDSAHNKGIRVVLDAVFNHCSDEFAPFKDVLEKGEKSPYIDWFLIKNLPISQAPANYETFGYMPSMPRFNTANEDLKKYLYSVVSYWTEEFQVDGWRLDVSDEPDHWFWRDFRKNLKGISKDLLIIGENWHDSMLWLMGDQFDTVMNYPATNLAVGFFAKKELDIATFTQRLTAHFMKYPEPVSQVMFNLLDSHDTERFLFLCEEDMSRLKNAAAFLFGYVGVPCTYYGTETGITGGYDPGCRRGFNWDLSEWNSDLRNLYKRLISIRKEEETLKTGSLTFILHDKLLIFKRALIDDEIYVVINNTEEGVELPEGLFAGDETDLITMKKLLTKTISPMTACYLKK